VQQVDYVDGKQRGFWLCFVEV